MRYFVLLLALILITAIIGKRLNPKESFADCLFFSWMSWLLGLGFILFLSIVIYVTIKFW